MSEGKSYVPRSAVVSLLRHVADLVESGDCRGAMLRFNGFFTEHESGSRFDAYAAYRTGNNAGQGGVVVLNSDDSEPVPPDPARYVREQDWVDLP